MSNKKSKWPKWMWRWHYLISGFVLFFGIGMLVAALQFSDASRYRAYATSADNVMGWLWADPIGWISLNDQNSGSCPVGPCGTYGVTVNTATRELKGYAWSDNAGWICFGSSCAVADCVGIPPGGGSLAAAINSGAGIVDLTGWAKVCNEGPLGWISLNCNNFGGCAPYPYKAVLNSPNKTFNGVVGHPSPNYSSLAWNGNSDGTGFGYVDFQYATLNTANENLPVETNCKDGTDNDLNGLVDCADAACKPTATCNETVGATDFWGTPLCRNGVDDNGNGAVDCADAACKTAAQCQEIPTNTNFSGVNLCSDTIDDNGNGTTDCADPGCAGYFACAVGEPSFFAGACSDGLDNDANGATDCATDLNCQTFDLTCTPAWLSAKFGNVYSQQGITGTATKPSTATYCLTANGAITGFTSGSGCSEATAGNISLPKTGTGYKGTLGSLDIPGILAGRYGKVKELVAGDITASVDQLMNGQVFHVLGNATLNSRIFQNGASATARGNGLLIVEGNLTIGGNLDYAATAGVTSLRNLASFGVIVKKNGVGTGNLSISPTVTKIVGAYFVEDTINTGTTGAVDVPLDIFGLMAAYRINLERNYRNAAQAAETVTFDGRAVYNPPPGMADVSKSLPASKDAF
ncbi:MAG: hypothetical protein WC551_04260 [Patescibacteria group bacterium]